MAKKTNEIAKVNMGALPVVGLGANLGQLTKLTKSTSYLRRIQLYSKGKAVDTRLIDPGCFGVPVDAEKIQSLGPEIDIIPLVVRSKAIDAKDRDAVIVSYDETTEVFNEIRERTEVKDSKCMWGFAFLVYERSTADYYEMFFGTKTARNEVPNLVPFLPRTPEQEAAMTEQLGKAPQPSGPCTIKSKYITKGDWGWHAPVVHPCSTPFKGFNPEVALEQMNKFVALKDSVIEKVEEEESGRAR